MSSASDRPIYPFRVPPAHGKGCRCYGTRYPGGGSAEVTIDGERVDSFNATGYEQQYPLWYRENLDSCPHTLVITPTNCPIPSCPPCTGQPCPPCFNPCLSIDFFRSVPSLPPRTRLVHAVNKPFRFTDEGRCPSNMPLPWIGPPGPGDQRMGPNFKSSEILAGTVGGALMLLFIVVAFLAWRVLFVLPMRRPTYKGDVGH